MMFEPTWIVPPASTSRLPPALETMAEENMTMSPAVRIFTSAPFGP